MRTSLSLAACMVITLQSSLAANRWIQTPGVLGLQQDQQVIWQFSYGTNVTKPCFHPLAVPGGPNLTVFSPKDHPWHLGLWFSWKYINGVNYWEQNAKTGLSEGKTLWGTPVIVQRPDYSARVEQDIEYWPQKSAPVMTEHRIIDVNPPDTNGTYFMDWMMTFTALDKEVKLDRTPLPGEPDGKPFGGYAGLSIRMVPEMKEVRLMSPSGRMEFNAESRYRGKALGMDYSAVLEGKEVGVAIVAHPENINSPSAWYSINDKVMKFLTPAVLCFQPVTLAAGRKMTLRYRVIVHPGRWDEKTLQKNIDQYVPAAK